MVSGQERINYSIQALLVQYSIELNSLVKVHGHVTQSSPYTTQLRYPFFLFWMGKISQREKLYFWEIKLRPTLRIRGSVYNMTRVLYTSKISLSSTISGD